MHASTTSQSLFEKDVFLPLQDEILNVIIEDCRQQQWRKSESNVEQSETDQSNFLCKVCALNLCTWCAVFEQRSF